MSLEDKLKERWDDLKVTLIDYTLRAEEATYRTTKKMYRKHAPLKVQQYFDRRKRDKRLALRDKEDKERWYE